MIHEVESTKIVTDEETHSEWILELTGAVYGQNRPVLLPPKLVVPSWVGFSCPCLEKPELPDHLDPESLPLYLLPERDSTGSGPLRS